MHHQCAELLAWHSLSLHACKRAAKKATPVQLCAGYGAEERTHACQLRAREVLPVYATPTRECLTHHARRGCRDGAPSRQHARPQACFEVRSSTKHMLVIDLLQIVSSRQQTLPRMRLRDLHVGARL